MICRMSERFFSKGLRALLPLCLVACLLPAAAEGAWPGKNGAIAFYRSWEGRQGDIWIAQPSGKQRRLTDSGSSEGSPVFSPDGKTIAFVRYGNQGSDIWLMNSDGTNKRLLVDNSHYDSEPHFFPGGRSLAFESSSSNGSRIFTIRTNGTELQPWAGRANDPAISADGRWFAYSRDDDVRAIVLEDLSTGKVRQLPSGVSWGLDFSPDSSRLVYTSRLRCRPRGNPRYAVMTIGLHGERPRVLLSACGRRAIPTGAVWSPNGKRLLVSRVEDLGSRPDNPHMVMVTPDGTLVPGAPRGPRRAFLGDASWQPLR